MKSTQAGAVHRMVKFYDVELYQQFQELCIRQDVNGTKAINYLVAKTVESGKLPAEIQSFKK